MLFYSFQLSSIVIRQSYWSIVSTSAYRIDQTISYGNDKKYENTDIGIRKLLFFLTLSFLNYKTGIIIPI